MIEAKDLPQPEDLVRVRRALISVFDKTGVVDLARRLNDRGIELISTGGTARTLREADLPVRDVSSLTGFPEILDGRVKTLHPAVHGGLLARPTDAKDAAQLAEHDISPIELVVVNLYPFSEAVSQPDVTEALAIENIDIGGPTMLRAAAKNYFFVGVVTSPNDYGAITAEIEDNSGSLSLATRRDLAQKAFGHTAVYDGAVTDYFHRGRNGSSQSAFRLELPAASVLRYGENPHQSGRLYGNPERAYEQLHGKALSFNNILDLSAGIRLIREFESHGPTVAILKHTNPCGVSTRPSLPEAYGAAFATDRQSPFGGIVVANRPVDMETAEEIDKVFTEIVIAPEFEADALELLRQKKNRRLVKLLAGSSESAPDVRSVVGGLLVQDLDGPLPTADVLRSDLQVVTRRTPSEREWQDLDFAWRVVKAVKSNAIVYVRESATLGVGAGQMSRVDSSEIAVNKGRKSGLDFSGSVVASDAFFPFADGLIEAARAGARAAIQPGGSIRDKEVIAAADEHDMAMVFTGKRHFRH